MKRLSRKLLFALGTALICGGTMLNAQSLDQAKKLYNDGKYAEAKPVFERLVKQAPSNASYNQWYGVCCFETNDMEKAEKHLKIAVKRRVREAFRYMGEIYFQTYRFEDAIEMYEEYIDMSTRKKQDTSLAEERLEMVNKASRMMDKVENIQVIDSVVVNEEDFLNAYTLSEESGTLTTYHDFFNTSNPDNSSVYMNQRGDKIFYAHATDENKSCLFTQSKLMDQWGDEKQLPMNVNSNSDDGYPFVLSDGVTIYYASKGNGSLGGYDLFITRYNMESDSYLSPEQLGMPFNSPFNDYMMVIDETKQLGWFVSDRFQPEGKVCVYLFIPNENRDRVESEDVELKRNIASLSSIKSTWVEGANYGELIELAHTEIPYGRVEIKKDFTFPINDEIVYYTLDEIKSPEAKSLYQKALDINRQIKELNEKLEKARMDYSNAKSAKREQLKPSILEMEEKLYELLDEPAEWEKKARNAEITHLKR